MVAKPTGLSTDSGQAQDVYRGHETGDSVIMYGVLGKSRNGHTCRRADDDGK